MVDDIGGLLQYLTTYTDPRGTRTWTSRRELVSTRTQSYENYPFEQEGSQLSVDRVHCVVFSICGCLDADIR